MVKIKPRVNGGFLVDAAGTLFRSARNGKGRPITRGPAKALKDRDYTPEQLKKLLSILTFKFDNGCGESFFRAADDLETIWVDKRMIPDPDRFTVSVHGNSKKVAINGEPYTADELATFLESPYSSWNGQNIRLNSCHTGYTAETDNPFAQQLADRLGVSVRAPDKYGITDWDGSVFSSDFLKGPDGKPVMRPDGNYEIVRPPSGEMVDFHPRPRT